ncbi:hypothetical protein SAMN04487967_1568 [Natronorubrum sediminis]|uniref:Uncharacterized protein n=1 Tax=Natronorubrum sediminis TaxID=640943 RepID=A0A1H6FU72_9EURY|nr:hypothetical protein [Natronorubrum sediminis]SEH14366.1 hypothetical protein SAMN04487967_1568 [Natronorubrum sediminis]
MTDDRASDQGERDDSASRDGEYSREEGDSSDDLTGYDEYAYRDANGMKRWTHCPKCHRKVMVVALVEPSAAQVAPCGCRLPPEVLKK